MNPRGDLLRNGARIGFRGFGGGESAVALELREIGPIGALHLPEGFRQPLGRERGTRDRAQLCGQRSHRSSFLL
jgi:hypothetical protein